LERGDDVKQIDEIGEGLKLLSLYDESGYSVMVEHDQLWAGPEGEQEMASVASEHRKQLEDLGWDIDHDVERWTYKL
jgi:hypothetical protein